MWRGDYNEDWRRQRELIPRELFQAISFLSPVQEEDGSDDASPVRVSPSSVRAWKPTNDDGSAWSPLPPLVVEREPNRHDEPPEFYRGLTRRMRCLYRKLFLEGRSINTSYHSSTDEELESPSRVTTPRKTTQTFSDDHMEQTEETHSLDRNQQPKTSSNNVESQSNGDYSENQDFEEEATNSEMDEQSPIQSMSQTETYIINAPLGRESRSSMSSIHYRQEICEAVVHREPSGGQDLGSVRGSNGSEESGGQCDDALLEIPKVSDTTRLTPAHLGTRELEVMRSPREAEARTSFGISLRHHEDSGECDAPETATHSMEEHNPLDISRESNRFSSTERDESSDDFQITLQSSTPKPAQKRRYYAEQNFDNLVELREDSISQGIALGQKRARYKNVATQCSKTTDWSSLRQNVFVGTPKIFKLCSCKDHRCGS